MLAHVEEGQEKAINKAVLEEEWSTAAKLLEPVIVGMLSSPNLLWSTI